MNDHVNTDTVPLPVIQDASVAPDTGVFVLSNN